MLQMFEPMKYSDKGLDVEVGQLLSQEDSVQLTNYILTNAKFRESRTNKDGSLSKRRNKIIYGEIPFYKPRRFLSITFYKATYRGKEVKTPVLSWEELPLLLHLKNKISDITKQRYNV